MKKGILGGCILLVVFSLMVSSAGIGVAENRPPDLESVKNVTL